MCHSVAAGEAAPGKTSPFNLDLKETFMFLQTLLIVPY
jgi:hypothetical protein